MIESVYTVAILALICLFLIAPAKVYGYLSAVSLFFYAQTTMGFGILTMLDPEINADVVHARIILLTLTTYTLTVLVASVVRSVRFETKSPEIEVIKPGTGFWALIGLSITISALYFMAVGYVALFESIRGLFSGTDVDAASLRLESYSGGSYYFPGYVNQFKNSLLPALVVIVAHYLFTNRAPFRIIISSSLILLSLIFLLGTGQRGAFVRFALIIVVYVLIVNRKRFKVFALWVCGIAIGIFFVSTAASGRASSELESAGSGMQRLAILFEQLIFRFTGSNQISAVAGFRYTYGLPTQNGREWFESLVGLLPGVSGSDLDNRIFATLYGGSTRGTSPPSLWGSIYHNFGVVGCFVLAIIIALILIKISSLALDAEKLNTIQAMGLAGMSVVFGVWIAGAPVYLFNIGIVIYWLLWLYGTRIQRRAHPDDAPSSYGCKHKKSGGAVRYANYRAEN